MGRQQCPVDCPTHTIHSVHFQACTGYRCASSHFVTRYALHHCARNGEGITSWLIGEDPDNSFIKSSEHCMKMMREENCGRYACFNAPWVAPSVVLKVARLNRQRLHVVHPPHIVVSLNHQPLLITSFTTLPLKLALCYPSQQEASSRKSTWVDGVTVSQSHFHCRQQS